MLKLVSDNGRPPVMTGERRGLLAKVHIARKSLAMDEDDYRAVLERATGHRSAKDCDDRQLRAALAAFETIGFRPTGSGKAPRDQGDGLAVAKARALWISLYQLGAIDDGSDQAFESFGRRQLGVERLRWSSGRDGARLIEPLKAIANRHGWDQHVPATLAHNEQVRLLKDRLVAAQLARLAAAGVALTGPLTEDRSDWSEKRLEGASAELGARIRTIPKTN